jgi:hypothetical protein
VARAKEKHLDPAIVVEQVRKGVAYFNTNGQMGERQSKDVAGTIDLAARIDRARSTERWRRRVSNTTPNTVHVIASLQS